jgi:AcrR family transcriptional regulator
LTATGRTPAEVPAGEEAPARRRYDSPVRRRQVAETRARIVGAGVELLHGTPSWNWHALTVRAVAEHAGVNERTVYRYFTNERELRDAVLARMEAEAGVQIEELTLDDLGAVTDRIFRYVASVPVRKRTTSEPTVVGAAVRQRAALLRAVTEASDGWSDDDRRIAAAVLDALWNVAAFEQMVLGWGLDPEAAADGIRWAVGLVADAIRQGDTLATDR